MHSSLQLDLHPGFYLTLAFMALFVPLKWCFAFVVASLFHEVCHFAAVGICGGQITHLQARGSGAAMEAWGLSPPRALLCTLAGPLGSLLLLPFARWCPRLALCAAMQTCYNLLPLNGLDGGHALRQIFHWIFPLPIAEKRYALLQNILQLAMVTGGIWCSFALKLGILPLLISLALILKSRNGKIPCK